MLMYGNLCAMSAAGLWVTIGIYLELALSSTHSIGGSRDAHVGSVKS